MSKSEEEKKNTGQEEAQTQAQSKPKPKPTTPSIEKPTEDIPTDRPVDDKDAVELAEDNLKLDEVNKGYRLIKDTPWNFPIRVYKNSLMKVAMAGDEAFTKERYRLLKDPNIPTVDDLTPILRNRNIWTEKNDEEIQKMASEIEKINEKIENAKNETEKNGLTKAREKEMNSFWDQVMIRESIYGDTIETRSEVARRMAMIVAAVRKHTDDVEDINELEPVWKDVKEFMGIETNEFYWVMRESQKFWSNKELTQNFFDESPDEKTSN